MSAVIDHFKSLTEADGIVFWEQMKNKAKHRFIQFSNDELRFSIQRSHRKWSKLIKERDGHKCVLCPNTTLLESHHCVPVAIQPELMNDLSNGVTLCHCCHICKVHGGSTFDLSNYKLFIPIWLEHMKQDDVFEFNVERQSDLN